MKNLLLLEYLKEEILKILGNVEGFIATIKLNQHYLKHQTLFAKQVAFSSSNY
jgi:hypothetical protein